MKLKGQAVRFKGKSSKAPYSSFVPHSLGSEIYRFSQLQPPADINCQLVSSELHNWFPLELTLPVVRPPLGSRDNSSQRPALPGSVVVRAMSPHSLSGLVCTHFCLNCNVVRYSRSHLFQNWSAKYCTFRLRFP